MWRATTAPSKAKEAGAQIDLIEYKIEGAIVKSPISGTVVEVRVFARRGVDKDERALAIERADIERLAKDRDDERAILERSYNGRLKALAQDHGTNVLLPLPDRVCVISCR